MARILVMANDSVLADAIVSLLTEEIDMDVLRVTRREPRKIDQAIREHRSVVIIVEEGTSEDKLITASDLFRDHDRLRILTISPEKHHLHICETYQVPISGMAQLVNLVRDFSQV